MRSGRVVGGWIVVLTVALVGGVPTVLLASGMRNIPWVMLLTLVVALAAPTGKILADKLVRVQVRRENSTIQLSKQTLGGGQFRLHAIEDATLLGVHPAILPEDMPVYAGAALKKLPVYIRRDRHDEIVKHLVPGSFTIVIGDSAAGKTRAAFEAVAMTLPDHYLVAPQGRTDLAISIEAAASERKSVLWLDDLERFIGADGLTVAAIHQVVMGNRHHRVIVATLRAGELQSLDVANLDRQLGGEQRRILEQAVNVRLDRRFSKDELARADPVRWDLRIDDALKRSADYGFAEYLAAAPRLLDDWQNAWAPGTRPRAAALVRAAIDCRRAGWLSPIPAALVEKLHFEFLEERGGARLRPEKLAEAWDWVTAPKHNTTTSLLERTADDHVIVFDYLVDHLQRTEGPDGSARRTVIEAALLQSDASTSHDIALTAYRHGQYDVARDAFERTIFLQTEQQGKDSIEALVSRSEFARVLARLGQLDDAAHEHRAVLNARTRVLGADHPDTLSTRNYLARTLDKLGQRELATAEFRAVLEARIQALGPRHPSTLNSRGSLASILGQQGKVEFALSELRDVLNVRIQVLGNEHPYTLLTRNDIAHLLAGNGELSSAADEYRLVIELRTKVLGDSHPETLDSCYELAETLVLLGERHSAEVEHLRVAEVRARVLGAQHPDTIISGEALARLRQS